MVEEAADRPLVVQLNRLSLRRLRALSGGSNIESTMWTAPVVHMGPYRGLRGALVRGAIGSGIGSFRDYGLDEAFSFAIGPYGD